MCVLCGAVENRDRVQTPHPEVSVLVSRFIFSGLSKVPYGSTDMSTPSAFNERDRADRRIERGVKVQRCECNDVSLMVMACMGGFLHQSLILHRLRICK